VTLYENGKWRARAVQGSPKIGRAGTGSEQVGVQFQILEGPDEAKYITWYGYFTEATTERTLEALRIAGWKGDDFCDLSTIGDDEAEDVQLVIEDEADQQGEMRSRAKFVNRLGSGVAMKDTMSETDVRAFAARMRGAVIAHNQKSGTRAPSSSGQRPAARPQQQRPAASPPRGNQAPPHTDDDLQF
jgi:hypothetical protein